MSTINRPQKGLLIILIVLFTFLYGRLQWQQRYRLQPDEISYLEIGQLYQEGKYKDALNAYWSPLFSLISIPFSYFIGWPYAGKLLNVVLIPLFFFSTYFFTSYVLRNHYKALFVSCLTLLMPTEFIYAWLYVTPDLLLTIFCIWFLMLFFVQLKKNNTLSWFLFGIFSGIGYLIKTIFLPIALIFIIVGLLIAKGKSTTKKIRYSLLGLIIIPIIWGLLLFTKYHKFTLGTNAQVNYKVYVTEEERFDFFNNPSQYHKYGTSYWIDPSDFSPIKFNLFKQVMVIKKNISKLILILLLNLTFGIVLILPALNQIKKSVYLKLILLFILIWYTTYSLILVTPRYLWPTIPFWFLIACINLNRRTLLIYCGYFLLVFTMFIRGYQRYYPTNPSHVIHWEIRKSLSSPCILLSDNWIRGMAVAYLSGCKYYGVTSTININNKKYSEVLNLEFQQGNITHFLAFNGNNYLQIPYLKIKKTWLNNQIILFSL